MGHRNKPDEIGVIEISATKNGRATNIRPGSAGPDLRLPSALCKCAGGVVDNNHTRKTIGRGSIDNGIGGIREDAGEQGGYRSSIVHHIHISGRGRLIFINRRQGRRVSRLGGCIIHRSHRQTDRIGGGRVGVGSTRTIPRTQIHRATIEARPRVPSAKSERRSNRAIPIRRGFEIEATAPCAGEQSGRAGGGSELNPTIG